MEKMKNISGYLLFFLLILLPLGTILCSCLGYIFKLGSCLVFAVITALLAITAAVTADAGKVSSVLFALAAPLSLVNAVFCIFECSRSSRIWIILCMLICIVCCCILTVKYGKPLALKIITLILSAFHNIAGRFYRICNAIVRKHRRNYRHPVYCISRRDILCRNN
ncbi:hypothetical protein B5F29_12750 [Lachnoclostridium sp. An196]|nr:hypothetical protein B5F29_12750 [Lachnoclostridium sp. An196]